MEIQLHRAKCDASDDELEWSANEVLECAQQMISLKRKIDQKAKDNIVDKEYHNCKQGN